MKLYLLALRLFKSYIFLSLVVCAEIAVSFFFMSVTVNNYDHSTKEMSLVKSSGLESSLYFYGRLPVPHFGEDGNFSEEIYIDSSYKDDMLAYLADLDEFSGMSFHGLSMFLSEDGEEIGVSAFDELTSEVLQFNKVIGKWYTDKNVGSGHIPCVVMDTHTLPDTYKIGDVIKGTVTVNDKVEGVEFEVTGIMDRKNALVLSSGDTFVGGEYIPSLSSVFERARVNSVYILCDKSSFDFEESENLQGIIYLKNGTSPDRVNEIYEKLKGFGSVYKFSDMYEKSKTVSQSNIKTQIPVIVLLLTAVVTGLICISLLNAKKHMKTFSLYTMCGLDKRKPILIYLMYLTTITVVSFGIYLAAMNISYISDTKGTFYLYILSVPTIVISVLVCMVIISLSALIPFIRAGKKTFIENYREFGS